MIISAVLMLLLVFSLILLFIGIIYPKAFKFILRDRATRRGAFRFFGTLAACFFLFLFVSVIISVESEKEIPIKTESEIRNDLIEDQFSVWDGSHIKLTKIIKQSMNDPESYEHVKTFYSDKSDYLIVTTTFRGKNAFGGVVANMIKAKVSLDGSDIEILEQD